MEELTEVITATEFHPTHCNLFMYSSSKSNIKLADMRDSALCDTHAKCLSLYSSCISFFELRILQASKKKRTLQRAPFSRKSYRQSRTSSLAMMGVISFLETTYRLKSGILTWSQNQSRPSQSMIISVGNCATSMRTIASLTNLNAYGAEMISGSTFLLHLKELDSNRYVGSQTRADRLIP